MPKLLTITLNSPVGASVGPTVSLTTDVGVVSPNTATVAQLLAGFVVILDDAATVVNVVSTGACNLTIPIALPTTTSTTSTTTTSTTSTTTSSTTTTTTVCPCNTYLFVGNSPVVGFIFNQCGQTDQTTIGLGDGESASYCVDNSYAINMFGDGSYNIQGDSLNCCPPVPTTTVCARPSGLISVEYFNTYTYNDNVVDYTDSLVNACTACNFINNNVLDIQQETALFGQSASFAVGQLVYAGTGNDCNLLVDGFYITDHETCQITEIVNGYIVNISNCEITP